MARLFLIRHGEPQTGWGGGDPDPGLSDAGRAQARAAAEQLIQLAPAVALTSPMRRCRETAAPFEDLARTVARIDEAVSEVPTPAGNADRPAWLQSNFPWRGGAPRLWSALDDDLKSWRASVLARVAAIDVDTAVFSHFIAINVIVGAATGREETIACRPGYASITELEVSGGALRLVRLGAEMIVGDVR